jgi:hypothetical protein
MKAMLIMSGAILVIGAIAALLADRRLAWRILLLTLGAALLPPLVGLVAGFLAGTSGLGN